MAEIDRREVLKTTRAWFARIAKASASDRFRLDYGLFLDDPERSFALADEALYIADILRQNARDGAVRRVLDLGCGFGVHSVLLGASGIPVVVGIDPATSKFGEARRYAELCPEAGAVSFVRAGAQALPFAPASFDAVLARESLSHVPEVIPALQEIRRVLRAGGVLHVRDYNNAWGIPGRAARRRAWRVSEEGPAAPPAEPFAAVRRRLLGARFPGAGSKAVAQAARAARGHYGDVLMRESLNFLGTGRVYEEPEFPFRDPVSGAAEERTFSPPQIRRLLLETGFAPRVIPPRHFHARTDPLGRFAAETRAFLIQAGFPVSLLATPLIECVGVKGEIQNPKSKTPNPKPLPSVTVVIPSRDGTRGGNVERLREEIAAQTIPADVEVIVGVFPCGRAHNEGARRAQGEILVFLDDDVRLGHTRVLAGLVGTLLAHPDVGIVGASQLAPLEANPFQRLCARDLHRASFPVVGVLVDTDMATHAAMAIRRDLYDKVGGEPGDLLRADDQVLRARVRQAGYRVVVAPDTWVFHPPPESWRAFARARMRDGAAAAYDRRTQPDLLFDAPEGAGVRATRRRSFALRAARAGGALFRDLWGGRWLRVASRLFHAAGYVGGSFGWICPEAQGWGERLRERLLAVGYTRTRFQAVDRELLSQRFDVRAMDFLDARRGRLRWWLRAAREVKRASAGALCWFADRHVLGIALLGRLWNKNVAVVVAGYETARIPEINYGLGLTRWGRFVARASCALARRVVVNSDFMKEEVRRVLGVPPAKIVRIHHGVSFAWDPEPEMVFPREPVVLTVADVTPVNLHLKGLLTFVAAARRVAGCRWVIAGPGEPGAVAALLSGASSNVEYAGPMDEKGLVALYRQARFYAQMSLFEGFGMALAEAMLYGCVPVTSAVGGMPEVTGDLGRRVRSADAAALAAAVSGAPPSRAEHEAASRRIRERFPLESRQVALVSLFAPGDASE